MPVFEVEADSFLLLLPSPFVISAGLYDSDPRSNPNAKIVHTVREIDDLQVSLGSSGSIGTGGMTTKLVAASIATSVGVHTGIIKSTDLSHIHRMMRGELVGTHFLPSSAPLKAHKKWIAHGLSPEGIVLLDSGAVEAIKAKKSLFAAGVLGVVGKFRAGASVKLVQAKDVTSLDGSRTKVRSYTPEEVSHLTEIAVCVVNYSSDEFLRLGGSQSSNFATILGYEVSSSELAHRENIVLTTPSKPAPAATTSSNGGNGGKTTKPKETNGTTTMTTSPATSTAASSNGVATTAAPSNGSKRGKQKREQKKQTQEQ